MRAFRHVGITVSNLPRAQAFYCDYLRYRVIAERHGQHNDYISTLVGVDDAIIDITLLEGIDGSRLELLQYRSHARPAAPAAEGFETGRPHIALTVANLDALYATREAHGARFKSAPLLSPDDPVMVAYCHDPDGTILELVQPLTNAS